MLGSINALPRSPRVGSRPAVQMAIGGSALSGQRRRLKLTFAFSCYLIKHSDDYMVWDTGFAPGTSPNAPKSHRRSPDGAQVAPEQDKYVGISHFHGDHTQLAPFTNATLLIDKED